MARRDPVSATRTVPAEGMALSQQQAELYALLRVHQRVTSKALLVPSGAAAHKRSATVLVELGLAEWDRTVPSERWAIRNISLTERKRRGLPRTSVRGQIEVTVTPR